MFNICINWVWAQARQASQFVGPLPKRNIKLKKKEAEKEADNQKKKQLKSSQNNNNNNNHHIMAEE